jgi:two-component system, chemotaxis family, sensor kinase CheA
MGELKSIDLDQLLGIFREQSIQIVDEMTQDLLTLESRTADDEAMTRLRRGAHTIKGDSACVGLEGVARITHKIEDAFAAALEGQIAFNRRSVDVMLESLDAVRAAIGGEEVGDVGRETVEALIEALCGIENNVEVSRPAQRAEVGNPASSSAAQGESKHRRAYVRVESAKVDALLNLASEMVIARSVINQIEPELEREFSKNELVGRLATASTQMGRLIGELQKSVLKMRMVTIDHVFRRFARPMRELAGERGKEFELEIVGGETELDRTLVDLLYEPLLHLLRNAVDHGLETMEERRHAGKPEIGRIVTRAYHEGNQVVVEVTDDGRGIDIAAVKARAIRCGALSKQEADYMPDEHAIELVFTQGVSTAEEITQLSGRGIGMAAVKSAVEQLRGTIAVESDAGKGTCFTLRLPLTLAIIKALLFTAAGRLFALPLLAVSEIAAGEAESVVDLDGMEHYRLHDRFVSLVRPGVVLGFDRRRGGSGGSLRSEPARMFLIVLIAGNKRYAVVADAVLGEQELVIKPLDSGWVQNDALAGASLLGDGRVVLIMDAEMVFRNAVRYERGKTYDQPYNTEAYAI